MDIYIVYGSDPTAVDTPVRPMEVYLDRDKATAFLVNGLIATFAAHSGELKEGGQLSCLLTRGSDELMTSASFVRNDPEGDRHSWDFYVQKLVAYPAGQEGQA
jgi:hypothetical protein